MDRESIILLQKVDCNCNDCIFMTRDLDKFKAAEHFYGNDKRASYRINYGHCSKLNKPVTFIPGNCQIHTQNCFKHRKDDSNN